MLLSIRSRKRSQDGTGNPKGNPARGFSSR